MAARGKIPDWVFFLQSLISSHEYGIIAANGYYTMILVAGLRPWPIIPYPLRFYGVITSPASGIKDSERVPRALKHTSHLSVAGLCPQNALRFVLCYNNFK